MTSDLKAGALPIEARRVLDRQGIPREVELLDSRNLELKAKSQGIAALLDCVRSQRVRPATIDKNPALLPTMMFFALRSSRK